jgi:hypothetical protein
LLPPVARSTEADSLLPSSLKEQGKQGEKTFIHGSEKNFSLGMPPYFCLLDKENLYK